MDYKPSCVQKTEEIYRLGYLHPVFGGYLTVTWLNTEADPRDGRLLPPPRLGQQASVRSRSADSFLDFTPVYCADISLLPCPALWVGLC